MFFILSLGFLYLWSDWFQILLSEISLVDLADYYMAMELCPKIITHLAQLFMKAFYVEGQN